MKGFSQKASNKINMQEVQERETLTQYVVDIPVRDSDSHW